MVSMPGGCVHRGVPLGENFEEIPEQIRDQLLWRLSRLAEFRLGALETAGLAANQP
jgi:hypothetical protein